MINNALKYAEQDPVIHIWAKQEEQETRLFVEDSGEGIKSSDIRRIFEKGFTGSNRHNGKYKSTGMGLYMVSKIIGRLGHEIQAESEYGSYTRFCIIFKNNDYYLTLQKL
ncbi:sensor histidine kinase GraS [Lachnospiraceae bacterium]|nr:sensor histidine kinase GraS [Lachnospiraceae bacterium]